MIKNLYYLRRRLNGAGVLSGGDPLSDTLSLFLVQATIIIGLGRFLSTLGYYLKQPQVIFEIISGILIGPSALGRIASFKSICFPTSSINYLDLVASIGLVLYLFIVGMELDPKLLKSHAKRSGAIAIVGMGIPFALGVAISPVLFNTLQGSDPLYKNANFTAFQVFIGTALSITAFPVLARILKEGGLIYTKAGTMCMGAAAINDAIAWILLILAISIANASDMSVAGLVFLSVVALALGLFFIIRPILHFIVYRVEAWHSHYFNATLFAFVLCLLFMCSWTTTLLGVHSIFGAFLFGLIIPRDTHLFRDCNERIEYVVMVMFLPLYFAISGLKTDVTQITEAKQWGMVVLVCLVATVGKFLGCGGPALMSGLTFRESSVVAVLMNTRGLVELIVLNLGVQSGILSTKTFSVMVIMCLFTTFLTAPLVECIYPKHMRVRFEAGAADHKKSDEEEESLEQKQKMLQDNPDGGPSAGGDTAAMHSIVARELRVDHFSGSLKMCVVVDSLTHLQHLMSMVSCCVPYAADASLSVTAIKFTEPTNSDSDEFLALLDGRLIRVNEESTGIESAAVRHQHSMAKPQLLPLSMFCRSVGAVVNAFQVIGDFHEFPAEMKYLSKQNESDVVLFPWRKNSEYFETLFWGCVRKSSVPIMLLVPRDLDLTATAAAAASILTGLDTGGDSNDNQTSNRGGASLSNASALSPSTGIFGMLTSLHSPITRRDTNTSTTLPEQHHVSGQDISFVNDIEEGGASNGQLSRLMHDDECDESKAVDDHDSVARNRSGTLYNRMRSGTMLENVGLATPSRNVQSVHNAPLKPPSKPLIIRNIAAIITGKDTDMYILSLLLRISAQPQMVISVYVAKGYKAHSKGTRHSVKLFARAANKVENIFMFNMAANCSDAKAIFKETSTLTNIDLILSSYIIPTIDQFVEVDVSPASDPHSTGTSPRARTATTIVNIRASLNMNRAEESRSESFSNTGAPPEGLPWGFQEERRRAGVPDSLINTTLVHPELGALGSLQYESALYQYISVFHEPTPSSRLARALAVDTGDAFASSRRVSVEYSVGQSHSSVGNGATSSIEDLQSLTNSTEQNGGIAQFGSPTFENSEGKFESAASNHSSEHTDQEIQMKQVPSLGEISNISCFENATLEARSQQQLPQKMSSQSIVDDEMSVADFSQRSMSPPPPIVDGTTPRLSADLPQDSYIESPYNDTWRENA